MDKPVASKSQPLTLKQLKTRLEVVGYKLRPEIFGEGQAKFAQAGRDNG